MTLQKLALEIARAATDREVARRFPRPKVRKPVGTAAILLDLERRGLIKLEYGKSAKKAANFDEYAETRRTIKLGSAGNRGAI